MKIIKEGRRRYIIDEKRDLEIYNKIKILEENKLKSKDKEIIKLIKTQLEGDWRAYLINYLNKLLEKYGK